MEIHDEIWTMIPPTERQQQLSLAYIYAVVAQAGYTCSRPFYDCGCDLSVDEVSIRNGKPWPSGFSINIQAKSTYVARAHADHIAYDLDVQSFNKLVPSDVGRPAILVVYCMPESQEEWLSVCEENSILKHCGYWCCLMGQAESTNRDTQVVHLSRKDLFDAAGLRAMMQRVRDGGRP